MKKKILCPKCNTSIEIWHNPVPTVDVIIRVGASVVLIERLNPPLGWALPGGFVDYGENLETAAKREALEETALQLQNLEQFRTYSDPNRDPRQHTISTVFTATSDKIPEAGDDAATVKLFALNQLPSHLCFDHKKILDDYIQSIG